MSHTHITHHTPYTSPRTSSTHHPDSYHDSAALTPHHTRSHSATHQQLVRAPSPERRHSVQSYRSHSHPHSYRSYRDDRSDRDRDDRDWDTDERARRRYRERRPSLGDTLMLIWNTVWDTVWGALWGTRR